MMSETAKLPNGQLVIAFNLPIQLQQGGGQMGARASGTVLGCASTHLIQPYKTLFKQKFRPKYA